jgi:hypothetical protein
MSMKHTKGNLERLLADKDIKVMALSGKWGTGKSEMWKKLRYASMDPEIKNALYVSLFGVTSITELKLKLVQAAAPLLDKKGPGMDALKSIFKAAKQFGLSYFKAGSAINEITLLSVPAFVREKFIVIDDIERKHDKLSIDEVLGFIDDFTQNYRCRMLLILNADKLADKTIWEKIREKVIDEELRLDTTMSEAFDIAIQLSPSKFSKNIKPAVEACGVTNIRIICKVIRVVNKILADRMPLPDDTLNRIIPSTVLLSAIHYNGIENGPTMDYFLAHGSSIYRSNPLRRHKRYADETEDDKLHARWDLLFQRLGIVCTDEYEKLVSDYLNSGLLDRSAVDAIIDRYCNDSHLAGVQMRASAFLQSLRWDPELTLEDVLAAARNLLTDISCLDCYTVTLLHDRLLKFEGGRMIAEQMVSSWIDKLKAKAMEPGADSMQFVLDNWNGRHLHPSIVTAFKDSHGYVEKSKTLCEVCLYLAKENAWGITEEAVMQSATVDDFMQTILSLRGEQLKMFLLKNMDIYVNHNVYVKSFGSAPTHFLEACRRIRTERAGTRWEILIEELFQDSKKLSALMKDVEINNILNLDQSASVE